MERGDNGLSPPSQTPMQHEREHAATCSTQHAACCSNTPVAAIDASDWTKGWEGEKTNAAWETDS